MQSFCAKDCRNRKNMYLCKVIQTQKVQFHQGLENRDSKLRQSLSEIICDKNQFFSEHTFELGGCKHCVKRIDMIV